MCDSPKIDLQDPNINIDDVEVEFNNTLLLSDNKNEIFRKFGDISTCSNKIRHSVELLEEYLRLVTHFPFELNQPKSNERSVALRKEGNLFFLSKNHGDYQKALELYNKSISFAENGSENLGLAYANRSAILFQWKCFDECLKNIELAKANNYPTHMLEILTTLLPLPTLTYESNKNIPFIVNCLVLEENKKYGRFIKTTKDLNPGDLIAMEEPFCTVLGKQFNYQRCTFCLNQSITLIPCNNCTTVMFCSRECADKGITQFHQFECNVEKPLQQLYDDIQIGSEVFTAIRVVVKLFEDRNKLDDVIKYVNSIKIDQVNPFTIDYNDKSLLNRYSTVHTLVTNQSKREVGNLFKLSTHKIFIILKQNRELKEIFKNREYETFFLELLFRHLQTAPLNAQTISMKINAMLYISFASCVDPLCSMVNHSCIPNIFRTKTGGGQVVFVLRPIKAGEQLFDNYICRHMTLAERQSILKPQHIDCSCIACLQDYPLSMFSTAYRMLPHIENVVGIEKLGSIDLKNNIKTYCKYLKKYDKFNPCLQLVVTQKMLFKSVNIMLGNLPEIKKISFVNEA